MTTLQLIEKYGILINPNNDSQLMLPKTPATSKEVEEIRAAKSDILAVLKSRRDNVIRPSRKQSNMFGVHEPCPYCDTYCHGDCRAR